MKLNTIDETFSFIVFHWISSDLLKLIVFKEAEYFLDPLICDKLEILFQAAFVWAWAEAKTDLKIVLMQPDYVWNRLGLTFSICKVRNYF